MPSISTLSRIALVLVVVSLLLRMAMQYMG